MLSDLSMLEKVRHLIPQDKIQELEIQPDYIRMKVDGLGQKICIRIVDREDETVGDPNTRMVKFGAENSPVDINFWIQLVEKSPVDTRVRLTLGAEVPFMFKMMLSKYESKIQEGLDRGAEMLAQFPYKQWQA